MCGGGGGGGGGKKKKRERGRVNKILLSFIQFKGLFA